MILVSHQNADDENNFSSIKLNDEGFTVEQVPFSNYAEETITRVFKLDGNKVIIEPKDIIRGMLK